MKAKFQLFNSVATLENCTKADINYMLDRTHSVLTEIDYEGEERDSRFDSLIEKYLIVLGAKQKIVMV